MYKNRIQAGKILAEKLMLYKNSDAIVLAIPRGGVPVGYVIATALHLPLSLILVKKIGHPANEEYAIGAVGLTNTILTSTENIPIEYIEQQTHKVRARLEEMNQKFFQGKASTAIDGKDVIIVDDGVATGNTLVAAIQLIKKENPGKIIVAVPVASLLAINKIKNEVDKVICPHVSQNFVSVGAFYYEFYPVSDDEVVDYLRNSRKEYQPPHQQ